MRSSTDIARPYRTFEFFVLAGQGDLNYLHPLFRSLKGQSGSNSYDLMDVALEETLDQPLPTVLINDVFLNRGASTGYPHCESEQMGTSDLLLLSGDMAPMSSQCIEVSGLNRDDECFKVNLESAAVNLNQALLLNGQDAFNGEALFVRGNFADIQVVDTDQDRVDDSEEDWQLRVEKVSCPAELLNCQNKRIVCSDGSPSRPGHTCSLQTEAPDGACWATVVECNALTGCVRPNVSDGIPFDFGTCATTLAIMNDPSALGIVTDTGLPATQDCGTVNLCRQIVLCAK